jgi:hypothetical protein
MEVKHEPTWEAEPVEKETKKKSKKKNEKWATQVYTICYAIKVLHLEKL